MHSKYKLGERFIREREEYGIKGKEGFTEICEIVRTQPLCTPSGHYIDTKYTLKIIDSPKEYMERFKFMVLENNLRENYIPIKKKNNIRKLR